MPENQTPEITPIIKSNLFTAFAKAQGQFRTPVLNRTAEVKKDGKLLYTTHYADLQEIIDCVREPLSKNGLCFFQTTEIKNNSSVLVLELAHESGEVKRTEMPINLSAMPQQIGTQLTYLKRYQLSAFFGLAADFDPDGNDETQGNEVSFGNDPYGKKKQSVPPPPKQTSPTPPRTPAQARVQELKKEFKLGVVPAASDVQVPPQSDTPLTTELDQALNGDNSVDSVDKFPPEGEPLTLMDRLLALVAEKNIPHTEVPDIIFRVTGLRKKSTELSVDDLSKVVKHIEIFK